MQLTCWKVIAFVFLVLRLGIAPSAFAVPTFSIINLGPADNGISSAKITTDAEGNQIVVDSTGQNAYPFPATPNLLKTMSQADVANLDANVQGPWGPISLSATPQNNYRYDYFTAQFVNSNGFIVGNEYSGVNGHYSDISSGYTQKQSDGSLPLTVFSGSTMEGIGAQATNYIYGLNKLNQVIGMNGNGPYLFDIGSGSLYNLSVISLDGKPQNGVQYVGIQATPFWAVEFPRGPLGLDAQGRILTVAALFGPNFTSQGEYEILLSPQGVATNPIPIPEPGSMVVFALFATGYGVFRVRSKKLS